MRHLIKYSLLLSLFLFASCKKESNPVQNTDENAAQSIFTSFWTDFQQTYPVFALNGINWDSVHAACYPKLTATITDDSLFSVLRSAFTGLKDAHADIYSKQFGGNNYYNEYLLQKPKNYLSWNLISSKYIQVLKSNNQNLAYGKIRSKDAGYFFIGGFMDPEKDYYMIDSFLTVFRNSKAVIFDIRRNGGGNETLAQIIASRLTNQAVIYRYGRTRIGSGYSDLSDYFGIMLNPAGPVKFTNTVIFLTSRWTFSSAEDFTLMLRSLPNTIQIGDTTFGGVATNPVKKTMSNGWTYRLPRVMNCDNNKIPIHNGIPPHVPVWLTKSDTLQSIDRILEEAINRIN
jgi:hypothetical protein